MQRHSHAQLDQLLTLSDQMLAALGEGDWASALELDRRRQLLLYNPVGTEAVDSRQRDLLNALQARNEALAVLAARMLSTATGSLRDIKAGARASQAYSSV
ncbi:MAG: hypothetical protein HKO62_12555 [Gammaproteobacteria bacterium]|nr:hypothetical protein [Gammaproteobacteria bacterium]